MSQTMPADDLRDTLRQMVAVLQEERQALAGLDLDGIVGATMGKGALCDLIEAGGITAINDECRGLLETARRLNEVNRQIRNLIAANVSARLDAITGSPAIYRARGTLPAYAYTGARG